MTMQNDLETHPWKWFTPPNCKILVVGTFPTAPKNRAFDFFYPNPRNLFWSVTAHLVNQKIVNFSDPNAKSERIEVLEKLNMGITDMGYKVKRINKGSKDTDLELNEYMDVKTILFQNCTIQTIILTSSSGPNSAFAWFRNYCLTNEIEFNIKKTILPFYGSLLWEGKSIRVAVLPSTSPAASQSIGKLVSLYLNELNLI